MYSICTLLKRTYTVHILYKYCTYDSLNSKNQWFAKAIFAVFFLFRFVASAAAMAVFLYETDKMAEFLWRCFLALFLMDVGSASRHLEAEVYEKQN